MYPLKKYREEKFERGPEGAIKKNQSKKKQKKRSFVFSNFNHSASYKIKNQKEDKKPPINKITTWLL